MPGTGSLGGKPAGERVSKSLSNRRWSRQGHLQPPPCSGLPTTEAAQSGAQMPKWEHPHAERGIYPQ